MNGPLKFLTARKILPLLNVLAKFKRVLACFLQLLASSQSKVFISARTCKKIAVLGMLVNGRKDHSSPLSEWSIKSRCIGRLVRVSQLSRDVIGYED